MSEVIIVDAEKLEETPAAFQRYVKKFFKTKTILGKKILYAAGALTAKYTMYESKGVAPTHSVDLREFNEGLKKDQSLNEWMDKADGKYLWRFYGHDDHDCSFDED